MRRKRIVCIGGGTGTFTALSGLKKYPVELTAIVSMTDSGGSNRVLRDEFGLLPTSDIRQCIVALASENGNETLRKLFTYRYARGTGISGMSFGNLFMAALTDIYGSQEKAIKKTCEILRVQGKVIPVTLNDSHLVARYDNGKQVMGEHYIDEPGEEIGQHRIVDLEIFPPAKANKEALYAIKAADLIVLGPGDLYTSIISNLLVEDVASAIIRSKAKKVYIMNLMTKFGQTQGFSAKDHLAELEKYLDDNAMDFCLINKARSYPKGALTRYKEEQATPVKDDLISTKKLTVIRKSLSSKKIFDKPGSDKLKRSLVRHDSKKLANAIMSLL
ncbi:MAG: hypothetical protein UV74_C0013G0077 [Candidatus Woesebacteria bacterium GW2011_GWB1_43_14]|uniref:Putative gluconeogenesis factor n=1 Tax=Candidatus Woesebacteria bacterium GW2011_GWB1_43_14 TaxID=1618578 RepID=A0A0G1DGC4_9BACT|nr:MAG: hypothetical protein UT21_C0004G0022 [Candidatus Woesebacteria bacterium GW2011_GWA1_39_11b]KKS77737.1 MAG: hypothetical protein UV51_C0005G0147 [Candidatus Woesebacteria bacterium GW2011_GWC1_42_9]KKS96955.1 MAG: hypothetical protein UV74_C0013G0077 [Candidatus Woesebacteria bacterium GW2011_GWB1_43_14]